ncbi:diphthine synthase [Haloparvum sp. PAK95]|uniref:diphthine synthase n=1 Tax=Haloparvum sp. PAK95 TaxID=3418962 RepID=UPI003D2F22FB
MLTFIGLGLYDERSITVEGQAALRDADRVFAEFYTSRLVGADVADLEEYHDVDVEVRPREGVEQDPEPILDAAEEADADVAFLTAGDTMISTTHTDLRLRAEERGIDTRVIHGVTAQSAASSLTGLQNYRFGKAATLPFPYAHGAEGVPDSVIETIEANRERGLHTLVYLDIKVGSGPRGRRDADHEEYMTADYAAEMLAEGWDDVLAVAVARAGSPEVVVEADRLSALATRDFGDPLHMLIIPGDLHHVEADALRGLAGAPAELVDED